MLKSLFNKVAGLMMCNFFKKKNCFPVSLPKFLRRPTLQNMPKRMLELNEPKKLYSQNLFTRKTGEGVLFSAVEDKWAYNFSKKGLHHRCFSMKIGKFYRTSALQNNALRLLLISCDIFNALLALSVINQFSHSQLLRIFRKEKCLL